MKSPLTLLGLLVCSFAFSQQSKEYYQDKAASLTTQIAAEPANLSLYYSRADAYDVLDDFAKSSGDYQKVFELYRSNPRQQYAGEFVKSCYRLADDYFFRQANAEKARYYVDAGNRTIPGFKELEIMDAILTGLKPVDRSAAEAKYVIAATKYPDDVRLNLYYAKFLLEKNPLSAAMRYEKALDADPVNQEALLALGTIYNNEATTLSGKGTEPDKVFEYAKKASLYFERLHKILPQNAEVTNILLRLYEELEQQDKAALLKKPY